MFNFIDNIEDWLEPMDYETFWTEIKTLARIELTRILKLQRNTDPVPMQSKAKH